MRFLRPSAAAWWAAEGRSHPPVAGSVGCGLRAQAVPSAPHLPPDPGRKHLSARGIKHINIPHHVTDLNIDNDFKGKKKVAHSSIPANAAELFKQALATRNNR